MLAPLLGERIMTLLGLLCTQYLTFKDFLAAKLLLCIRAHTALFLPLVLSIQQEKSKWWRLNKKPSIKHLVLCSLTNTAHSAQKQLYPDRHHWHNPGPCHLPSAGVQLLTSQEHKLPFSQTPSLFYWMVKEVTVEEDKAELSVPLVPDTTFKTMKPEDSSSYSAGDMPLMPSCVPATSLVVTDYPTMQIWLNSPWWKFLELHSLSLCSKEAGGQKGFYFI